MNITLLTNEYPPHIYGGAGVHVEYLTRELVRLEGGANRVRVLSFGDQSEERGNLTVQGVEPETVPEVADPRFEKFMDTLQRDLIMAGRVEGADVVHCHTWYTHLAGLLVKPLTGAKLVLTTHSLEPHRPWKVEQLGAAYHASSWIEKTAYGNADGVIAVSESMKRDVHKLYDVPFERIRVIPNGIDPEQYRPTFDDGVLKRYGVDPEVPFVLFVGRVTRQKGILHLVNAIKYLQPGVQVVLCAGAPDTKGDWARDGGRGRTCAWEENKISSGSPKWSPKTTSSSSTATRRCSCAPRCTSPSASSTWRRWPAKRPWSPPRWGASPRSSCRGRRGCSCPWRRARTLNRRTPKAFPKAWRRPSTNF